MHLPSASRPPIARGTYGEAIQRIMSDLDDFSAGCRVHGNAAGWDSSNEMVEESFEIGDAFFRNWWWCLDARVLSMTNRWRRERGVGGLRLGSGGAVGD